MHSLSISSHIDDIFGGIMAGSSLHTMMKKKCSDNKLYMFRYHFIDTPILINHMSFKLLHI